MTVIIKLPERSEKAFIVNNHTCICFLASYFLFILFKPPKYTIVHKEVYFVSGQKIYLALRMVKCEMIP